MPPNPNPLDSERLARSLPEHFSFYHRGEVSLEERQLEDSPASQALAFAMRGDLQVTLVLMIGAELDVSMYSEMGNIIASKLVTRLADEQGIDLVLSPPRRLAPGQLGLLERSAVASSRKTYVHRHGEESVLLEARFLVFESSRGVGESSSPSTDGAPETADPERIAPKARSREAGGTA